MARWVQAPLWGSAAKQLGSTLQRLINLNIQSGNTHFHRSQLQTSYTSIQRDPSEEGLSRKADGQSLYTYTVITSSIKVDAEVVTHNALADIPEWHRLLSTSSSRYQWTYCWTLSLAEAALNGTRPCTASAAKIAVGPQSCHVEVQRNELEGSLKTSRRYSWPSAWQGKGADRLEKLSYAGYGVLGLWSPERKRCGEGK